MAVRVVWTSTAKADFKEAVDFLRSKSPSAARKLGEDIKAAVRLLRDLPERGHIVPEMGKDYLRQLIVGRYRVVYRLGPELVEIIIAFHNSQDPEKLRSQLEDA